MAPQGVGVSPEEVAVQVFAKDKRGPERIRDAGVGEQCTRHPYAAIRSAAQGTKLVNRRGGGLPEVQGRHGWHAVPPEADERNRMSRPGFAPTRIHGVDASGVTVPRVELFAQKRASGFRKGSGSMWHHGCRATGASGVPGGTGAVQ